MKRFALPFLIFLAASCATASTAGARPRGPMSRALDNTVALTDAGRIYCTGFVSDGYVVTAAHCVEGEVVVTVERRDGKSISMRVDAYAAEQDVARLSPLSGTLGRGIPLARKAPGYGDEVFVLGHSGGDRYPYSLTRGIVSHPRRVMGADDMSAGMVWMHHDAQQIGGNSGGPVMNSRGQIVGVTSFTNLHKVLCAFSGPCPLYVRWHISGAAHLESVEALLRP